MNMDKEHAPILYVGKNWKDEALRYSTVFAYESVFPGIDWIPLYSSETLTAQIATAEAKGIAAGLEMAAKVAETSKGYPTTVSEAIRALIKEPTK